MILSQLIGLLLLPTAAVSNLSPETEQALRGSLEAQLETAHEGHTVKHLRTLRKRVFDQGGGQGDNLSPGVDPTRNKFVVNPVKAHPTKKNSESGGDLTPKIVNGNEVDPPRKYKFFASIGGCGASLVAPNVLLSAAHCSEIPGPAILGLHYKTAPNVDEFEALEVIPFKNDIPHPLYSSQTLDYDFWVIELEWDSQLYQDHIVELDTPTDDLTLAKGYDVTVIGMGTTASGGSTPSAMQEVTVDYITNADCCASPYSYSCNEITDRMLCAARPGKDSCQGDSGGPLFVLRDGKYKQVGVVSWGYGCADSSYPGVYSRVDSEAYTWIKTQIDNYNSLGTNPPPAKVDGQCYDSPEGWFDRDGPSYSCDWYGSSGRNCSKYGDRYANAGTTANKACCVCGGGAIYAGSPTTKSPTGSPTTSSPTNPQTPSPTNVPTTANPTQTIPPVTKYLCRKNPPLDSDICLSGLELDAKCSAEGLACGGPKTCHVRTCSNGGQ